MKKTGILIALLSLVLLPGYGQGAKNIKINEVMPVNTSSIEDSYGEHKAWIELANVSFSTYNVRGMFVATTRDVLDKNLSAPERMKMMSIVPSNSPETNLGGRQHLVLWLNSSPAKGSTHLNATLNPEQEMWIGLYEGNGVDLVDSVTVPAGMSANTSYARQKDGSAEWEIKAADAATPGIENYIQVTESKVAQIKRDDPHGFGITILSMGIVFLCLALLWIFFTIFGKVMGRQQDAKNATAKAARKQRLEAAHDEEDEDERAFPRIKTVESTDASDEVYVAVISMAIRDFLNDIHDNESDVITLIPKPITKWKRV